MKPITTLVTIASSGTPQRLTTDTTICVNSIFFKPLASNSGAESYVGVAGMVISTGVGVISDILSTDSFATPQTQNGLNQLHPADYWLDSDATGDKILVTWWIA